jgi:hypothetical protein
VIPVKEVFWVLGPGVAPGPGEIALSFWVPPPVVKDAKGDATNSQPVTVSLGMAISANLSSPWRAFSKRFGEPFVLEGDAGDVLGMPMLGKDEETPGFCMFSATYPVKKFGSRE